MAEVHDRFDSILILDFESKVPVEATIFLFCCFLGIAGFSCFSVLSSYYKKVRELRNLCTTLIKNVKIKPKGWGFVFSFFFSPVGYYLFIF